jgi:rSAM/selenodomain-associated transferase 1
MNGTTACHPDRPSFMYPNGRLLIFAKAPLPGQVKTRLVPPLSAAKAARLHAAFIERTLQLACEAKLCPVQLWCCPHTHHPFFSRCRQSFPVTLHRQEGADLGARMHQAASSALSEAECVVLIGCDCPALAASDLSEALDRLEKGYNAVLGPAEDGGYVLLGLRQSEPEIFSGIEWGNDTVLDATRSRLRSLGWHWHELAERWDVDRPEDLLRLKRDRALSAQFDLFGRDR